MTQGKVNNPKEFFHQSKQRWMVKQGWRNMQ